MELNKICAAAVIVLGALTMACHAGQAVQERRNPQYTMVSPGDGRGNPLGNLQQG